MTNPDPARLQALIDRQDILDCISRYTRGVDRMDRELLLSAYHPDAIDDHGVFVGSAEKFVDWIFEVQRSGQKSTMHCTTNHSCELQDSEAHTETYCLYFGHNQNNTIDVCACRYIDRFQKRDGEWRIFRRVCTVEWLGQMSMADLQNSPIGSFQEQLMNNVPRRRDRDDISYQRPLDVVRHLLND